MRRSNSYQSRKCALVKTEDNSLRAENALLPSEGTWAPTLNSLRLGGIIEVTDLLPVGLHSLGSHWLILLSHNGSKSPLPAYWSQKQNKTPSTEFKRDTESKIHLSLLNFFQLQEKGNSGGKIGSNI